MAFLLDSTILIDHFNGISSATTFIQRYQKSCFLSVITRAEVLAGVEEENLPLYKQFMDYFKCVPITEKDADLAAELRRSEHWKLPDALQAALAKNHALKLITRNTKDFPPKQYSFVKVPYKT